MAKRRTRILFSMMIFALWMHPVAWAQIQAGRALDGTLWLTDGNLPGGIQAEPLALDQLMTLPGHQSSELTSQAPKETSPNTAKSGGVSKKSPDDDMTCRGIQKRYAETKNELDTVAQKKAAGTLLIPDSGMVTLRQNLATLERLRSLCD